MNKKGTHVEVIISFVIFITFVVFLFVASKPAIIKQEDKTNLLDNLEYKILEKEISADVKVISVTISSVTGNCVNLGNFLDGQDIDGRVVVKNSSGDSVEAHMEGNSFSIDSKDTFFKIYYSEEFDLIADSGATCTPATPNVGLVKNNRYVLEEKVYTSLNKEYEQLKEELGIGGGEKIDFTYGIVLSNGTIIEKEHPELKSNISTSIYVRETPIEYVNKDYEIVQGYLRTTIW